MKKVLPVLLIISIIIFTSCGGHNKNSNDKTNNLKIGLILSAAGLGDKSFNDSAYRGVIKAKEELGIEFKCEEPDAISEDSIFLRKFAEEHYDLIIATGFEMKASLNEIAQDFPESKYVLIDTALELPNIVSLIFKEEEGSFLVGALAAMISETNTIGFVGGINIPLIKRFEDGYRMGAKYINPDIKVIPVYIGDSNPWNDPAGGREKTSMLVQQGVDVVYHAAGGTGIGVIEEAERSGIYAIGVDSDQDDMAKGTVLTSMMKNIDDALFEIIKSFTEGEFKAGTRRLGIAEHGVGTTKFEYTRDIIGEDNINKLEQIKQDIVDGKIKLNN